MSTIIVQRGNGTRYAPDISAPLAVTDAVKVARGRRELDAALPSEEIQLEERYLAESRNGQLARSYDTVLGRAWKGKITSVRISVQPNGSAMTLTLSRPA